MRFALGLMVTMCCGPLLLFGLTAMAPIVRARLDISQVEFGFLSTATFASACVASYFAGRLTDRVSGRTALGGIYLCAIVSIVIAASASTYQVVVLAVLLSGFAVSFGNPVTNRLIAMRRGAQAGGVLVGIKQSGVLVAQFITGLTLPAAALLFDWRGALALLLVLPVVGAWLSGLFVLRADRAAPRVRRSVRPIGPLPRTEIIWFTGYAALSGVGVQAFNTYLALFSFDLFAFKATTAGVLVAAVGAVGVAARIGWGALSGRATGPTGLMIALAVGAAAGCLLLAVAGSTHAVPLLWVGTIACGATVTAASVVTMAATIRMAPDGRLGIVTGIVLLGQYSGFLLGAPLFGVVSTHFGYTSAWVMLALSFASASFLMIVGKVLHRA